MAEQKKETKKTKVSMDAFHVGQGVYYETDEKCSYGVVYGVNTIERKIQVFEASKGYNNVYFYETEVEAERIKVIPRDDSHVNDSNVSGWVDDAINSMREEIRKLERNLAKYRRYWNAV